MTHAQSLNTALRFPNIGHSLIVGFELGYAHDDRRIPLPMDGELPSI
jgi:hypothetical protein